MKPMSPQVLEMKPKLAESNLKFYFLHIHCRVLKGGGVFKGRG